MQQFFADSRFERIQMTPQYVVKSTVVLIVSELHHALHKTGEKRQV